MNVEIAQRLAELRREKGYSQEELAERLGLSRQAVSKWERAESSPDTGNLVALARLYGVTVDELLRFDEEIEDDVKFETRDRGTSSETKAQEAAEKASAAAAQATFAATQAAAVSTRVAQQAAGTPPTVVPGVQTPPPPPNAPVAASSPYTAPYPDPLSQQQPSQTVDTKEGRRTKGPWSSFPYPVLATIIFLVAGFFWGTWHPAWVIFLTIPLYYWVAHIIENDPNYRK